MTKKYQLFISINLLTRYSFIELEDINELLALMDVCFTKQQAVGHKEKMGDHWAASTNGYTTQHLILDSIID